MKVGRLLLASGLVALLMPGVASARLLVTPALVVPEGVGAEPVYDAPLPADTNKAGADEKFVWPVKGEITTYFDGGHAGIDIDGEYGDRIVAARSGQVTFAGDDGDGYGVKVIIKHPGGFKTLYSHLSSIEVEKGPIARGELVGLVGCTGSCTGDHLHFEILEGGSVTNPLDFLP